MFSERRCKEVCSRVREECGVPFLALPCRGCVPGLERDLKGRQGRPPVASQQRHGPRSYSRQQWILPMIWKSLQAASFQSFHGSQLADTLIWALWCQKQRYQLSQPGPLDCWTVSNKLVFFLKVFYLLFYFKPLNLWWFLMAPIGNGYIYMLMSVSLMDWVLLQVLGVFSSPLCSWDLAQCLACGRCSTSILWQKWGN